MDPSSVLGELTEAPDPATVARTLMDLGLDRVFDALARGREAYDLLPILRSPSTDVAVVRFRHEVFRDLERAPVRRVVDAFAGGMREVRRAREWSGKLRNELQRARWWLEAVRAYGAAADRLARDLAASEPRSAGLVALRDHLESLVRSESFQRVQRESEALERGLNAIRYTVRIEGSRVTIGPFAGEPDYSAVVESTFRRFPQGAGPPARAVGPEDAEMDPVEEFVQDQVARRFPELFVRLRGFPAAHPEFVDRRVARFDREVQFYLAYLDHLVPLREAGLAFAYPVLSERSKEEEVLATFDLALAGALRDGPTSVVPNDVRLHGPERILVVSGPNNGGKTTYARTVGQLHYLAQLGCPVPGQTATLLLCDRVLTHFERGEPSADLRGNLADELVRVREILRTTTDRSVVVLNETFASAALEDALELGRAVIARIVARDALAVYVTFVDELSVGGPETVSLVSTTRPDDPAVRTYRVLRRAADGRAYALAIAEKHGLSYAALRERIRP